MTDSTPTGISDNGAGALAYITIIPAIILTVAWIALFIVLAIVGRLPIIGWFVWPLMMLIDLGMFILWLFVVLKALNGVKFSIPIIGPLAEQQANK